MLLLRMTKRERDEEEGEQQTEDDVVVQPQAGSPERIRRRGEI
jgi:hypothetical protein